MPDGSITMPACAHDQNIGPHNMFFQQSAGIMFGNVTGSTMVVAARWNVSATVTKQATGIYRVVHGAFDTVAIATGGAGPCGHAYNAQCMILGDNASVTTVFKFPYLVRVDSVTMDVYIRRMDTGVAIDLDNVGGIAASEFACLLIVGRRITAATTPFSTFGSFAGAAIDNAQLNG